MTLVHLFTKPTKPIFLPSFITHFSTSFLITKTPKKFKKKRIKKPSARTTLVQTQPNLDPNFENILLRDTHFRFLTKTKEYLSKQPQQIISLDQAGKLHQQLGFPRGRKVLKSILRHPLIFETYRHSDDKIWFGFTDFMDNLLKEEEEIVDKMEKDRVNVVRKLLMMSCNKRIALSKIYHNRLLFGISEDFRDRIVKYPDYFRVVVEEDGKRVLELVNWDNSLAVSALEKEFLVDEEKVKKAFRFPVKHGRALELDLEDERKLNMLNTLPLVSPYSDGSKLDLWTLEAEKYRVGVIHEFLSLTLERRAYIHNIVEFKEEFSLTRQTYQMLLNQPRTFYLAGTEMNWCVFLKDGYGEDGELVYKDPQVIFNSKLYKYADVQELGTDSGVGGTSAGYSDQEEIDCLMKLFEEMITTELHFYNRNDIHLSIIGNKQKLSESLQSHISAGEEFLKGNKGLRVVIPIDYSGLYDITQACMKIATRVRDGVLRVEEINEHLFEQHLETSCLKYPNPDLLIRTSGEHRSSNFMLWQMAYTELHFSDKLFPDFGESDFVDALKDFQQRERRYGGHKYPKKE